MLDWKQLRKGNWVRFLYPEQPRATTMEGWDEFEQHQRKSPIKYFLAETFPDWCRATVIWPIERKRNAISDYLFRQPVIKLKSLKPGWYDTDTKILHANFQLLSDYVEIECAWMEVMCHSEIKEPNKLSRRMGWWRSAELGTKHLARETGLADLSLPPEERCERQAIKAQQALDLYHWWKARDSRPDPYDASGWTGFCATRTCFWGTNKSAEEKAESSRILDNLRKIEKQYYDEDTAKLIALIKIRNELWT
jgi:hypothetical protein